MFIKFTLLFRTMIVIIRFLIIFQLTVDLLIVVVPLKTLQYAEFLEWSFEQSGSSLSVIVCWATVYIPMLKIYFNPHQ